ncbi:MAG: hypothetical protein KKC46_19655 [Proteobacteria bacterium]|nr:hypothetical protein [Pseudomonadota bacterium]
MKNHGLYRKNETDSYALHYFPDTKQAEALHLIVPPIGSYIGTGKSVVFLENITNEEALEKLKEVIDKL